MRLWHRLEALERLAGRLRRTGTRCPTCRAPQPSLPRHLIVFLDSPDWSPSLCPTCRQAGGHRAIPLDPESGQPAEEPMLGAYYALGPWGEAGEGEDELALAAERVGPDRAPLAVLIEWLVSHPGALGTQHDAMIGWLRRTIATEGISVERPTPP